MVCSQCKLDGHTRATCPELVLPVPLTPITLSAEDCEKLAHLAGLCIEVARGLGKGHVEGAYQQALGIELQEAGIAYGMEEVMPIIYNGRPLGGGHQLRLDVILYSYMDFIYELKAVSKICSDHHWQLVRYMSYKNIPFGAVVNFNQSERGQIEIQFIVLHEGNYWLYDSVTKMGRPLADFSLV